MIEKVSGVEESPYRCDLPLISTRRRFVRTNARSSFVTSVVAACLMGVIASASAEQSVTLAWEPSSDTSVVGYRVHALEENATTATPINVLGLTKVTLPGLKEGLRYTFTVTSYNAAGIESAPSNAAEIVVPVPLRLLPGTAANATKLLQFPMAPGHWYELQASANMQTWSTIWQTGIASTYAWTDYSDPASSAINTRFYRLKVH